ncbi:MAG: hypothetical protein Kow00127_18180 [Bacteroidales bacterium]
MKIKHLIIMVISAGIFNVHGQIISDFLTDTDNWHSEGDGVYYFEAAQGNPPGCFRVDDDATGDWNNAFAPVKFLGDWSMATSSDFLSVDLYNHFISGSPAAGTWVFQIAGPGGKAQAFVGEHPPYDIWTNYTATLDPSNWTMISGDWNTLLQQVTEVIVRAEYINGDEFVRLDNVTLSFTPVVIPVTPVICSDFEDGGYDGWSFASTGGISNSSSGGNPGRCIRISDGGGTSTAFTPPKFLGDWSLLDNHGADIRFDLKITDYSGPVVLSSYFLRISGPGGAATFLMDNQVNAALDRYKTFVFPIDQAYWSMESGSWANLLANVTEAEIIVEFINGSEVVWFDNFCISNLPPVADFTASGQIDFAGNPIQFYDMSLLGPDAWNWDFGDSQTSTDQHPVHIYNNAGIFDVGLTASNFFGSDNLVKTNYIEILPIDQCLKFEDNFDDNSINPVWSIKNGTWVETGGTIGQTSNFYTSGNLLGGCFSTTGSLLWNDYVLSCRMMSTDNDFIGLVFNRQDELNMYMFYWNLEGSYRRLVKWVNGAETVLAAENIGYTMNNWYDIRIYSIAGEITLLIDGKEVFSITDNTFTGGKAGLFCSGNQSSYWDDFRVACPGTPVDIKVMLEGAYNSGQMSTGLTQKSLIPFDNPYGAAPWNYAGNEGLTSLSNPDIVDWLLLEFRDAPSASQAVAATTVDRKAALLLKDGSVVSPYSNLPVYLSAEIANNLYVVVYHRNHLPVMSANPVALSGGSYSYDFTTSTGQAYGTGAQKDLGGVAGMIAGDINADGVIDNTDHTAWAGESGMAGYLSGDLNLDGEGDNPDKNDFWYQNRSKGSQIPE